jgi:hypothetical protein
MTFGIKNKNPRNGDFGRAKKYRLIEFILLLCNEIKPASERKYKVSF